MRRTTPPARLSVGGAVAGGFIGIFTGAVGGIICGLWTGDISLGLDGAILAGLVLAACGAVYGAVLAFFPSNPESAAEDPAPVLEPRPPSDPATDLLENPSAGKGSSTFTGSTHRSPA